jgi:chorismate dehydratase
MNHRLRIGAVSYLNTKPLVYRFGELNPAIDLMFDLPSRLADRLADGELDVALIPSIEYLRHPQYTIVSTACIACRGPVLSVKLLSRKPMHQVRSLALDEGSRTSSVLARVLLHARYGIQPRLELLPVSAGIHESAADAILLIGDRAIHTPTGRFAEAWDLGDQWCRWSELPFVFAMWIARSGVDVSSVESLLDAARDLGVRHLAQIAAAEAPVVGLPEQQALS